MESRLLQSSFRLLNAELAEATATASIEWAVATFGSELCLLASMQDAVLIDLAVRVDPDIDVVFLDNGYHFEETLQTRARIERHYGITIRTVGPLQSPAPDVEVGVCCDAKPALLEEVLDDEEKAVAQAAKRQRSKKKKRGIGVAPLEDVAVPLAPV